MKEEEFEADIKCMLEVQFDIYHKLEELQQTINTILFKVDAIEMEISNIRKEFTNATGEK